MEFSINPDSVQKEQLVLQREEKLRTDILNAFKDVVAFYSPTHTIIWMNDAGKKQLGINDDSYIGKLCHKVWFGSEGPCPTCPVVTRNLEPTERMLTLYGDRIWMVRHTPLFSDGELTGFIEFRADVTHISDLEKQILDEREKYKLLAENAPFGLILTRSDKPVYSNKTLMDWLGFETFSDFIKADFLSFVHPHDRKRALEIFSKLRDNDIQSPCVEKLRVINNEGKISYYRFDLKNNTIGDEKLVQIVISDITSEVLKEKKQKQVAADALYINQKNSMLTDIEIVLIKTLSERKFLKSDKEFKKIFEIINSYKQLDRDWKMLIANFEEVHPGFFSRLKKTYPKLSPNDIKHCACMKMNFDTKEIARFFNIKAPSVQIGRVRIKKKMNLQDSVDLRSYIMNF
jgi:PAS domain S-box-containing protein